MKIFSILIIWFLIFSSAPFLYAEHEHDHDHSEVVSIELSIDAPSQLDPDEVLVRVKGIVCSFCAYGVSKRIRKLDFLDTTKHEGKGVLVDIKSGEVRIATDPEKEVDLSAIRKAVVDGGYEPLTFFQNASGVVKQVEVS